MQIAQGSLLALTPLFKWNSLWFYGSVRASSAKEKKKKKKRHLAYFGKLNASQKMPTNEKRDQKLAFVHGCNMQNNFVVCR